MKRVMLKLKSPTAAFALIALKTAMMLAKNIPMGSRKKSKICQNYVIALKWSSNCNQQAK